MLTYSGKREKDDTDVPLRQRQPIPTYRYKRREAVWKWRSSRQDSAQIYVVLSVAESAERKTILQLVVPMQRLKPMEFRRQKTFITSKLFAMNFPENILNQILHLKEVLKDKISGKIFVVDIF